MTKTKRPLVEVGKDLSRKINDVTGRGMEALCGPIMSEYKALAAQAKAMAGMASAVQKRIKNSADQLTETTFKEVNKCLDSMNAYAGACEVPKKLDISILDKSKHCPIFSIFSDIVPEPIANAMVDAVNFIGDNMKSTVDEMIDKFGVKQSNELNEALAAMLAVPVATKQVMEEIIKVAKDNALTEALGDLKDEILSPMMDYGEFLQDMGVNDLITKMEKIEKCCLSCLSGKDKRSFSSGGSLKPMSKELRNIMMLDQKGNFTLTPMLGKDFKKISQFKKVQSKLGDFMKCGGK